MQVGAVAQLVGVSVRTLHHYDEIALVVPSGRTPKGYRTYSSADVERLHRVLTYRELGFALDVIATLLDDPAVDAKEHLRRQRDLLAERIDHLHAMATAVDRMLEAKEMGIDLNPEEQREIFGDNWLGEQYAEEAEQRWGKTDAWKQARERTASFDKDDWKAVKAEMDCLESDFAAALRGAVAPDSAEAGDLAERHRATISRHYDCDHAMQVNLARMYIADERFAKHYNDIAPNLAQYVHDVIVANAARHE